MPTFKAEIVFVRILAPFASGIAIAYWFSDAIPINLMLFLTLLLFLLLLFGNSFYKKLKLYKHKSLPGLLFIAFFCCFGMLICLLNHQSLRKNYFAKAGRAYLKGYVSNEPQIHSQLMRFQLNVKRSYLNGKWQPKSGNLSVGLRLGQQAIELNYGDEVFLFCKPEDIEPPYNSGEFDFKAWLALKNIYHQTFIEQTQLIKLNRKAGHPILSYAIKLRQKQVSVYRKLIRNDEAFAVASTLILGYRADLSAETLETYSKTGTIHALSVSGMHVGIIYIFLNWVLFFLDRKPAFKILKLLLICTLIWYYSLLTGLSPSVLRSAVMLSVYIIAKSFNRSTNAYNILAFTAFCLLVYDPFLLWDVGFELSFLAVFGLVYLQPKIYGWFHFKPIWLDKIWSVTAISLAAQLATFPLSIYYFHQFPLYFIISNLFILVPITVLMYLGLLMLILKMYFLAPLFEWLIVFTNKGLKWIADLPFAGINGIWINQWQLLLLTFSLIALCFAFVRHQKRSLFTGVAFLIVLQGSLAYRNLQLLQQQKILCFSLRKNYATAFINGRQAVLLSDLSQTDRNFRFFVQPALDQLHINKLVFLRWNQDTTLAYLTKRERQLAFGHYKLLLLDSSFNSKKIAQRAQFDLLWIHRGFKKNLSQLQQEVQFRHLVIDASVRDYQIRRYQTEANKIKARLRILKKNNSYLIDLKAEKKYE